MRAVLKYLLCLALILISTLYIYFLKFLPQNLDLNTFKPQIQKLVNENSGLNIEFSNLKLITTPALKIGVLIQDAEINLSDNSRFVKVPCAKALLSLPDLLLLNVKISELSFYKPLLNIETLNGKEIKAVKTVENFLYEKEKSQNNINIINNENEFDPLSLIRINLPNIGVYDYRAYIIDDITKDYLLLRGDKISLAYNNGKRFKIKTNSKLFLNKNENINADIDIDSYIPKKGELDEEDDPARHREMSLINLVSAYKKYNLKADINAKLKIDEKDIKGFLNVENLTLNLGDYTIPNSNFKFKSTNKNFFINTYIGLQKEQYLNLIARFNKKKKTDADIVLKSNGIYLDNFLSLLAGIADSTGLKTQIPHFKGNGYFTADTEIKMRTNKLKSKGEIALKNGFIVNKKAGLGLSDINFDIILDDNTLKVENSGLKINDGEIKIEGLINKKSDTNLSIKADKLPLTVLYNLFANDDLKKTVNLKNGVLFIDGILKGKLNKAEYELDTRIQNLALSDKSETIILNNDLFEANFSKNKNIYGVILNNGLKIYLPYSNSYIANSLVKISFDENDIELNPTQFRVNKNSAITLSGVIDNYKKSPEYNFKLDGNFFSKELKTFLGASFEPFIEAKGIIPLKANLSGDRNKQTLKFQIAADSRNYITPIKIRQIADSPIILQFLADFKGNRIKIKNTGLYSKYAFETFSDDMSSNLNNASEILSLEGTISELDSALPPMINMLRFKLNKPLDIEIIGLKNSKMNLRGGISVFGNTALPRTRGAFYISNLSIPDLLLEMKRAKITFQGKDADIQTEGLTFDNSDLKFSSSVDLRLLPLISLNNSKLLSNYIDVDLLASISEKAALIIPKSPVPIAAPNNIPILINSGSFNIKSAKTGNITAKNIRGNYRLKDNVFFVNNLFLNAFRGNLTGELSINLLNYLINANLNGSNMDVNELLVTLAGMKDTLTGKLSFNADVSLRGLEYNEQVKSLDGVVKFLVQNGQAGPFAKIENIFLSENLRNSDFFKSAAGSIITSAVSVDTSRFSTLDGVINFKGTGIAYIDSITMAGSALCLKITGEMDVLKNHLNSKVKGRLGSMASSVLGPLANVNPINIVKAAPGLNVVMAKAFSFFTEEVTEDEMKSIPNFTKDRSDFNATKFQLVLRGDINKPLKLLKSFKWLVTKEEFDKAQQFVSSVPDELPDEVKTLEELQIYKEEQLKAEMEKKTFKGKIKNMFKKDDKNSKQLL